MITSTAPTARHPVEELAEDFLTRYRRGERPSLVEYVRQFPDVADELADIIQALMVLEGLGVDGEYSDESTSPLPERLGEYRLVREIGRGGMGIVYEAEQIDLGRHVALKILPAIALLRPTHLERFRREARAAARLHHTNIIPVYGVGVQDGIHYYAMQYIPGRGLEAILRDLRKQRSDPVAETDKGAATLLSGTSSTGSTEYHRAVARVGLQMAEALAHAHGHGVLHRDVKPANVIMDDQGTAWLGDFGLAYLEGDAPLTGTGGFVGTLLYIAPERFKGEGDARSDVYSLGATLYELLTLRPMFDATDRTQLIRQVTQDEPLPPRRIDRAIPKDLETLVLKAIAKDPADRYATSGEMAEDMRRFIADRPLAARRISSWELFRRWVRRNPLIAGLLAAVFLSLGVGLGATWWQWQRAETSVTEKTEALNTAKLYAIEAGEQSQRAKAHGHRAFEMLDGLLTELNTASERQPVADLRRRMMERAFKVHEEFINETPVDAAERLDVAKLSYAVGDMHFRIQQWANSDKFLTRGLALIEPEASETTGQLEYRYLKARTLAQLGINHRDRALTEPALDYMEKSSQVYRGLIASDPSNRRYVRGLGGNLHNRGIVASDCGQHEQAIGHCREAIAVTEPLLAADPSDAGMKLAVARFYNTLTNECLRTRRFAEAQAASKSALDLADELEKLNARAQRYQELVGKCADSYGSVFVGHAEDVQFHDPEAAKKLYREAEKPLRRALAARQRLVELNRTDPDYRHDLGNTYCRLSAALIGVGQLPEAEPCALKAVQEHTEARRLNPNYKLYVRGLCIGYFHLGRVYCAAGDHAKAGKLVATMQPLVWSAGAECLWTAQLLCQCAIAAAQDAKLAPDEREKMSHGYNQQALGQLEQGVARGYTNRAELESSVWLRTLRDRPEFHQILANVPAKKSSGTPIID